MGREEGEEEEGRWTGNGFDMHRHVVPSLGIFFSNNPLPSFRSIAQLASYRLSCVPSVIFLTLGSVTDWSVISDDQLKSFLEDKVKAQK